MKKTIGFVILALIILLPSLTGCLTAQEGSEKLEILEYSSSINEYGYIVIDGTAKNISSSTLSYAEIVAKFYNVADELVGTSSAKIKAVDPDEIWSFQVLYPGSNTGDIAGYKVEVGSAW